MDTIAQNIPEAYSPGSLPNRTVETPLIKDLLMDDVASSISLAKQLISTVIESPIGSLQRKHLENALANLSEGELVLSKTSRGCSDSCRRNI